MTYVLHQQLNFNILEGWVLYLDDTADALLLGSIEEECHVLE